MPRRPTKTARSKQRRPRTALKMPSIRLPMMLLTRPKRSRRRRLKLGRMPRTRPVR